MSDICRTAAAHYTSAPTQERMHVGSPIHLPEAAVFRPLNVPARQTRRFSDLVLAWVDERRTILFAILAAIYIAGFNAQWRLEPDSALYLSIGRNLADGRGYTYHGKAHRLAYPGVPVIFAGVFKTLHTRSRLPLLILMPLMGMAVLALTYRLVRLSGGRPTAVIVTIGLGMSRLFYRYNFELLSDLPFLLGVMAFLVGYEAIFFKGRSDSAAGKTSFNGAADDAPWVHQTRWWDWALLIVGLAMAVTTRPAMIALVIAVVLTLLWSMARRRFRWGQALVCVAVIAAAVIFYARDPRRTSGGGTIGQYEEAMLNPDWFKTTAKLVFTRHIPLLLESTLPKAAFGISLAAGLNTVLGIIVLALGVGLVRRRLLWGMWVVMTLLMVLIIPKSLDRYILAILPLLVFAWWEFICWVNRRWPGRWGNAAFAALFCLGAMPNGAKIIGFILEQQHRPFRQSYKEGRYASVDDVVRMIQGHTPSDTSVKSRRTAWIMVAPKFGRVLTYLSSRYAVEPDEGTQVDPEWQSVYVLEPSEPPEPLMYESGEKRPTVHEWLAEREFAVAESVLASTPNKDPHSRQSWTLHQIVRVGPDGKPIPAAPLPTVPLQGAPVPVAPPPPATSQPTTLPSQAASR